MKLISEIRVDHFRSIRDQRIADLGDFTAFAGLNNSGKSNLLRALHAFFYGKTDVDTPFSFRRDYFCHEVRAKKAKRVAI